MRTVYKNKPEALKYTYNLVRNYIPNNMPNKSLLTHLAKKEIEEIADIVQRNNSSPQPTHQQLNRPALPENKYGRINDFKKNKRYKTQMSNELQKYFSFINEQSLNSFPPVLFETLANVVEGKKNDKKQNKDTEEKDNSTQIEKYKSKFHQMDYV